MCELISWSSISISMCMNSSTSSISISLTTILPWFLALILIVFVFSVLTLRPTPLASSSSFVALSWICCLVEEIRAMSSAKYKSSRLDVNLHLIPLSPFPTVHLVAEIQYNPLFLQVWNIVAAGVKRTLRWAAYLGQDRKNFKKGSKKCFTDSMSEPRSQRGDPQLF